MKSQRYLPLLAALVLMLGALAGGRFSPSHPPAPTRDDWSAHPAIRGFTSALQIIDEHYGVAADRERLTRGAVQGMLRALDPHSGFFDRREFNEMQDEQSSKFYGVGVTINQRNGRIYVLDAGEGLPAERAGLRYGDAIIEVDGKPTRSWTQADALRHVRGERGTAVELTVERLGFARPLRVQIVRGEVPFPSVRSFFMLRPGIGYIGLTGGFNQTTSEEVREALRQLKAQGMTSLLLDLRRNPGGLFRQAVQVAEEFLPRRVEIVSVRSRQGRATKQVYQSDNAEPETMPLVVLINRESASASEIVAGAIQDRDRGLIVGEDSFGKGLVQTVFRTPGGTGLTLTTAKYYTPSGRSIQRAYDGVSIYDYFATRGAPQASKSEAVYTPTGRRLEGGGGIKPDLRVESPEEPIRWRDACFEFARRLTSGLILGFEGYRVMRLERGHQLRGTEFQLTEGMIAAFRAFLREHPELRAPESEVAERAEYIRHRLRAELITAAYGIEVAEQFLLESDLQAQRAIEALPQAKHLSDLARLFPAPSPTAR
jgi:carboxyl-terminal processing protease